MKPTVSKQTEDYLKRLDIEETQGKVSEPYHANPDAIDQLIHENSLKIAGVNFYPQIEPNTVGLRRGIMFAMIRGFQKF